MRGAQYARMERNTHATRTQHKNACVRFFWERNVKNSLLAKYRYLRRLVGEPLIGRNIYMVHVLDGENKRTLSDW